MDKNFRLTITYDGTKYLGWQKQSVDNDKTIQGKIENILKKMTEQEIELIGSGRTDAGVHALKQTANFHWDTKQTGNQVKQYINKYLPDDIAVTDVKEVAERFHSRYNVKSKTYLYRLHIGHVHPVFDRKYVYYLPTQLDVDQMIEASKLLIGEHDFKGFSSKAIKKSTVRTIQDFNIIKEGDEIKIYIKADGFLYNMVRIIVGTLIEVGLKEKTVWDVKSVLEHKDRIGAGVTAPAQGLILYDVEY